MILLKVYYFLLCILEINCVYFVLKRNPQQISFSKISLFNCAGIILLNCHCSWTVTRSRNWVLIKFSNSLMPSPLMISLSSMPTKIWSRERLLMTSLSSSPKRKSRLMTITNKPITPTLKSNRNFLPYHSESSSPSVSKNNKLFLSSTSRKVCWKTKTSSHLTCDSTKLKDTLPLIRKMLSLKSLKDWKKKDWKSVTASWSSRKLKAMLWANSGKNTVTITIPSLRTWRKVTRKKLKKKRKT